MVDSDNTLGYALIGLSAELTTQSVLTIQCGKKKHVWVSAGDAIPVRPWAAEEGIVAALVEQAR